jgi:hypothetical protein
MVANSIGRRWMNFNFCDWRETAGTILSLRTRLVMSSVICWTITLPIIPKKFELQFVLITVKATLLRGVIGKNSVLMFSTLI